MTSRGYAVWPPHRSLAVNLAVLWRRAKRKWQLLRQSSERLISSAEALQANKTVYSTSASRQEIALEQIISIVWSSALSGNHYAALNRMPHCQPPKWNAWPKE